MKIEIGGDLGGAYGGFLNKHRHGIAVGVQEFDLEIGSGARVDEDQAGLETDVSGYAIADQGEEGNGAGVGVWGEDKAAVGGGVGD